jgi:murein DD-endopeptidase MepM/ murein hydrolase activator NlpD
MTTLYAHQSQLDVSYGQEVAAAEVIGYIGTSGLSTGPHLHFEVRLGGRPVDPADYI